MKLKQLLLPTPENDYTPHLLQRAAVVGMFLMIMLSFAVVNMHALMWQSSQWLVSTVLPAVVVDLTNTERKEIQAAPLRRNTLLDEAARMKAEDMAKNSYFAHYSPDGVSPWHWFDEVSYTYAHAGENLAIHFKDSGAVVEAWMNSPAHRANIVNTNYTEIGVGTAKGKYDGYDTVFVVQLFGTPALPVVAPKPVAVAKPAPVVVPVVPVVVAVAPQPAKAEVALVKEEEPTGDDSNVRGSEQFATEEIEKPVAEAVVTIPATKTSTDTEIATTKSEVTTREVATLPPVTKETETSVESEERKLVVAEVFTEGARTSVFSTHFATSSGLAPVVGSVSGTTASDVSFVGLMTRPSVMLQSIYLVLGLFVFILLLSSIVIGFKYHRPLQVVYGVALLMLMSGLFYVHASLTASVVVAAENSTSEVSLTQ
jgi:Cysteine-rich secretory protein family